MTVILASASPRRKELLKKVIQSFEVIPSDIDETIKVNEWPLVYVERMAKEKAKAVNADENDVVIGCDTTVVSNGQILLKPKDAKEAHAMLRQLSGKSHQVLTSVYMTYKDKVFQKTEEVEVTFYPLDDADITTYLETGEYQDKAGAYAIQGQGALFVKSINGDYYAIVGLPVGSINQVIKKWLKEDDRDDKK